MIAICSLCKQEMEIDSPNGIEYIKEADETIHHVVCPELLEDPVILEQHVAPEQPKEGEV